VEKESKVFVAGAGTLVGSAILRKLKAEGFLGVLNQESGPADLCDPIQVDALFSRTAPEYVFLAAGKSGGIIANTNYPAEFIRDNLQINVNVIHSAYVHKVIKLLYVASSCCYPRICQQPMREEYLLTGPFEPTNEAYSIAKIAGIKLCQSYRQQYGVNFISVIPPNLFGLGDDFHSKDSHVVAALIRKIHEAKELSNESVEIWGTGNPRREFVYVDDLADACIFLMRKYDSGEPINAGGGSDLSIRELAERVKKVVGFSGELVFNSNQPDGMPIKLLDSSRLLGMGWKPKTSFSSALSATYDWYLKKV